MFKERSGKTNINELEQDVIRFWEEKDIFKKSLDIRKDSPAFIFYEGPPTANGRPGIHHVMSRTVKDVVCRYKTMTGHLVNRKAGWDTHGLPVEIEVEKQLGFSEKEEIEAYGVDKFNEKCKESVFKYKEEWDELTRRIGNWLDLDHPYITFKNDYIETVWWILKTLFDKNLIYQGFKILPFCPRCETPLSSHEVSQGYKDVKDPSIYVKFKISEAEDTYFLVWTTTPWTLISNVALTVHPEVDYIKVEQDGEFLILAEARAQAVLGDDLNIVEKYKGSELLNIHYDRLFDYVPTDKDAFYVVLGDFVTTSDGTGIVHTAPAFGEDDYQVGRKYDLPVIHPVKENGEFDEIVTDFKNQFVKDADPEIILDLKKRRLMYRKETVEHSYPHCWRCDSPLLYYARKSWYIKTTEYREKLLKNNAQTNWYPKEVGEKRFGEWLKNNIDWALSRDRYWGTPLNIWKCEECEHLESIGSIEELKQKGKNVPEEVDLHKPHVDHIEIDCPECNHVMKRVPEVIDVWLDSGSMPYAQWHYPFENKEVFENAYPADFICEGVDQTRGWFYSMLALSTMLFDKPAFKNVVVNELILDKNGQKMSKSKGNAVVPGDIITKYGADPLRWYFVTVSSPWVPKRFDEAGIAEVYRKFFDTLSNTYGFFSLYANIDGFNATEEQVDFADRPEIDRWILSLLYSNVQKVNDHLQKYDLTRAGRIISEFIINDVSNWYVRRNRRRFWKGEMNQDKLSAYQTLYEVLLTTAKLIAPFAPMISDDLYRNLRTDAMPESVHLDEYPQVDETMQAQQNEKLERQMFISQQVVSMARSLRNDVRIKVRQPLSKIIVASPSASTREAVMYMSEIIKEEVNIKNVEVTDKLTDIVNKKAKPNFKQLGPKVGKMMKTAAQKITQLSAEEIEKFETEQKIDLQLEDKVIEFVPGDIEILEEKKSEDLAIVRESDYVVGLATDISAELEEEGIAREFVNRIQNLRKDSGFEVTDRIGIYFNSDKKIANAIENLAEYIKTETLALKLLHNDISADEFKEIEINKEKLTVCIEKVDQ